MEHKINKDLELLRSIMRRLPELEGVDVEMRDGFIMMSPVRPVHSPSIWRIASQLEAQLPEEADLAVNSDVEFAWPAWNRDCAPDVILWEGQADRDNLTRGPADLITFACEVISPSSVGNDYVDKAAAYGQVPIAAYLILDPYVRRAVLHSHAGGGEYRRRETFAYGEVIDIDLPSGPVKVDTSRLPVAPEDEQRDEWPQLRR